jgi:hypothetical protein
MKGIANESVVGVSAYASPHCFVMELSPEGVLCASGLNGGGYHDGIYGDDDSLI